MRLIFLGSPESVLAPLKALLDTSRGDHLVGVVSQPPRPVGRGGGVSDPPVAAFAKAHGIPTLQPTKASDPAFLAAFAAMAPDVAITAAFGQILPPAFLAIPRRATINIHPSLLPRHRGATPVQAALLAGDDDSGISVLFTVQALDAGALIVQERRKIPASVTAGQLTHAYFAASVPLLHVALDKLRDPAFVGEPQDAASATFCRKIVKQDGDVDWERSAETVFQRFRAYEPWPGSYTHVGGRRLNLIEVGPDTEHLSALPPGSVTFDKRQRGLRVATGEGEILLFKVKPAGGKVMTAEAFWNGLKDRSHVLFTKGPL